MIAEWQLIVGCKFIACIIYLLLITRSFTEGIYVFNSGGVRTRVIKQKLTRSWLFKLLSWGAFAVNNDQTGLPTSRVKSSKSWRHISPYGNFVTKAVYKMFLLLNRLPFTVVVYKTREDLVYVGCIHRSLHKISTFCFEELCSPPTDYSRLPSCCTPVQWSLMLNMDYRSLVYVTTPDDEIY